MTKISFVIIFTVVCTTVSIAQKIDRRVLVARHNVELFEYNYNNALQVGNGQIAIAVDITGLQSFDPKLGTYSEWGWNSFPQSPEIKYQDVLTIQKSYDREISYPNPAIEKREKWELTNEGVLSNYKEKKVDNNTIEAYNYFRSSPHRIHLGQIGFEFTLKDGRKVELSDIKDVKQTLDLWRGLIQSSFSVDGTPVNVITYCHPTRDVFAVDIKSDLLKTNQLKVFWSFPYNDASFSTHPVYSDNEKHSTEIIENKFSNACLKRTLDDFEYFVDINWTNKGAKIKQIAKHKFLLSPGTNQNTLSFSTSLAKNSLEQKFSNETILSENVKEWNRFWTSGGAIDLSESKDPRWKELERRIILSQYVTAIQCAGDSPPQETGLFNNSWYGKFHLEMITWHGVHFALWNRTEKLERWMQWFLADGKRGAKERAVKQGFKGVRWNKMIDKYARWESPSSTGPYRITQQGHVIYMAELLYRLTPGEAVLNKYSDMVFNTAEFMADFVNWDNRTQRYVLGPGVKSGAEAEFGPDAYNPTVELSYWAYGLETAQKWRERLGMGRHSKWDEVLKNLSYPPIKDSVYINMESHPNSWRGRPAWLEAYGCMPGTRIDSVIMKNTFDKIVNNYDYWEKWIWGCDFPMIAMCAARLNNPKEAIDWLLFDTKRNTYLPNGANIGGPSPYYPANGGLLWAIAMMCAGWDGAPDRPNPGFPNDGSWVVKWEGLHPTM